MRLKGFFSIVVIILFASFAGAADPKLEGAYKLVSVKTPQNTLTEANIKGMIVVHGKYLAFVRANADRKMWTSDEPSEERNKKIIAAFLGLAATAGTFEVQGNVLTLTQMAQAVPSSVGAASKWEFKLEGNKLSIKPQGSTTIEFTFERMP